MIPEICFKVTPEGGRRERGTSENMGKAMLKTHVEHS
jgi:hypothetical protein